MDMNDLRKDEDNMNNTNHATGGGSGSEYNYEFVRPEEQGERNENYAQGNNADGYNGAAGGNYGGMNGSYDSGNYNGGYNGNYNNNGNNYGGNTGGFDTSPMTVSQWLITLIVMMIPCVGIIMYFVWGFSSSGNVNRRNFCRAGLIIEAVVIVLYILIVAIAGNVFMYGVNNY